MFRRLYLRFREPRVFLAALCVFVATSLCLHFILGYDADWGGTNLTLSIEASIASAVIMMVAEESADMQRRNSAQQAEMLSAVLSIVETQDRTLKGVLLIAEAQRDMLVDHAGLLNILKEGDKRILDELTKEE